MFCPYIPDEIVAHLPKHTVSYPRRSYPFAIAAAMTSSQADDEFAFYNTCFRLEAKTC
jgi:hypothetical protein